MSKCKIDIHFNEICRIVFSKLIEIVVKTFCIAFLFMMSFMVHPLLAQKMFWSDMTLEDKDQAINIANQFIEYAGATNLSGMEKLSAKDKIFTGNGHWVDFREIKSGFEGISSSIDFSVSETYAYTFDEFLDDHINNTLINKCYEVFDNHSVLVIFNFKKDGNIEDCLLSIKKNRNSTWEIQGIIGLFSNLGSSSYIDMDLFNEEKIADAGISIPIPKEFDKSDNINGQTIFYYEGKSGRDAAIQIMMDELKAKIYYYTYKFVEHNNQQFKMSNLIVKYIPAGIKYEYEVIDPSGATNKGITVGIERSDKVVLIQYYSFLNVYTKIKSKIDYALTNVK